MINMRGFRMMTVLSAAIAAGLGRKVMTVLGLDPDERVMYPHPKGYAVALYKPRCVLMAQQRQEHDETERLWAEARAAERSAMARPSLPSEYVGRRPATGASAARIVTAM